MREVLRHRSVERVVMVDIDEVVTSFCGAHLATNTAAFADPRLELIHDDARAQLEQVGCSSCMNLSVALPCFLLITMSLIWLKDVGHRRMLCFLHSIRPMHQLTFKCYSLSRLCHTVGATPKHPYLALRVQAALHQLLSRHP